MNIYLTLGMISFFGAMILLTVAILNMKKKAFKKERKKNSLFNLENRVYDFLLRVFILRFILLRIRKRLELASFLNERELRKKAVEIFFLLLFVFTFLLSALLIFTSSIFIIGLFAVFIWLSFDLSTDIYLSTVSNRLLKGQIRLNELIRHEYFSSKMVDEAIYLGAANLSDKEHLTFIQAQKIYDVLTAKDVEKSIIAYNETVPNKFFKMLLALSYMTMEYGDNIQDESSVFMRNLSDLTGEIRLELSKRERINNGIFSLNFICLAPLLFISPIKDWSSKYFLPLKIFYESELGLVLKVVSIILAFISFIAIRKLASFNKGTYEKYDRKLLKKIYNTPLKIFIDYVTGLKNPNEYKKIKKNLFRSFSSHSPETFMTQKLLLFLLGFLSIVLFIAFLSVNEKQRLLNEPTLPEYFLGGKLSEEDMQLSMKKTKLDNNILEKTGKFASYEDIVKILELENMSKEQIEIRARGLIEKRKTLDEPVLFWQDLVISLFVAMIFYYLPNLSIAFRNKILAVEIDDEIAGFNSIILILMQHKRLSVLDILEWMEMYSIAFRGAISDCINDFNAGSELALLKLSKSSNNERFLRIISGLIAAEQDISIKDAFYELIQDKQYFLEKRKILNEEIIMKKINLGKFFGFLPLYSLIVLYMIVPMILCAMNDMNKYFEQLNF